MPCTLSCPCRWRARPLERPPGPRSRAQPAQADRARALALCAPCERLDHVPGEVLVKFRAGTDAATQARMMALAPAPAGGPTDAMGRRSRRGEHRFGGAGGGESRRPRWPASPRSSTRSRTTSCAFVHAERSRGSSQQWNLDGDRRSRAPGTSTPAAPTSWSRWSTPASPHFTATSSTGCGPASGSRTWPCPTA